MDEEVNVCCFLTVVVGNDLGSSGRRRTMNVYVVLVLRLPQGGSLFVLMQKQKEWRNSGEYNLGEQTLGE